MTNILFAQPHDNSLHDNLSKLGESMFGKGAQNEMHRQQALEKMRHNANAEPFARAARDGDPNNLAYYGALSGRSGRDTADFNLVSTTNRAKSVDDPRVNLAQIGAHEPIASTAIGQGRAIAGENSRNAATIAGSERNNIRTNETSERNNIATVQGHKDTEVYKHDNTPYVTYPEGIEGPSRITSQSEAIRTGARGAPPSKDQVIGGLIQKDEANPPPPGGFPRASTRTPDQRHLRGETTTVQHFVHQDTNEPVESHDGGLTFVDRAGRRGFLSGSGFVPSTEAQALPAARAATAQRQIAATPEPPSNTQLDPAGKTVAAPSAMENDAADTSGLLPAAKTHLNNTLGAMPVVPGIIKAITGSPDIGPVEERAAQDTRNMKLRSLINAFPGKPNRYSQEQMDRLLPHGAAFANPQSEATKAAAIEKMLRSDRADAAALGRRTPEDAPKYRAHIDEIDAMLREITGRQLPQAAPPPAAAPAPADAAALKWANENPSDPRAAKIRQLNGIK